MLATSQGSDGRAMNFVYNELSLHGQFPSIADATQALRSLLELRGRIQRVGLSLRAPTILLDRRMAAEATLRQVIAACADRALKTAAIAWLSKDGPFWDHERRHSSDDYFECRDEVVTDSGLAEAAFVVVSGESCEVVSSAPSSWLASPLRVDWHDPTVATRSCELANHWEAETLERRCAELEGPITSWADLERRARRDFARLTLAMNVVAPLDRLPFHPGAAREIHARLRVLNELKGHFTQEGRLDAEGLRIKQDYFVGGKAWFSDSSDTEKVDFRKELTFPNPAAVGDLFCPWHGKVKIEQLRIHYRDPITKDDPLFVVYIGPKLTKR